MDYEGLTKKDIERVIGLLQKEYPDEPYLASESLHKMIDERLEQLIRDYICRDIDRKMDQMYMDTDPFWCVNLDEDE